MLPPCQDYQNIVDAYKQVSGHDTGVEAHTLRAIAGVSQYQLCGSKACVSPKAVFQVSSSALFSFFLEAHLPNAP